MVTGTIYNIYVWQLKSKYFAGSREHFSSEMPKTYTLQPANFILHPCSSVSTVILPRSGRGMLTSNGNQ